MLAFVWPILCALHLPHESRGAPAGSRPAISAVHSVDGTFFASSCTCRRFSRCFSPRLPARPDRAGSRQQRAAALLQPAAHALDYGLARLTVLVGMLSIVTWVPGMLLFALQVGLAGVWWFRHELDAWCGYRRRLSLVDPDPEPRGDGQLRVREVADRRGRGEPGLLLHPDGVAEMIDSVFRVNWGHIIDPAWSVNQSGARCWRRCRPKGLAQGPRPWRWRRSSCCSSLVIERKLRPVEIVR